MDIEVIQHHRNSARFQIRNILMDSQVRTYDHLVEEFLCFYDYNGLAATIQNVKSYINTMTNQDKEQRHLQLQLVTQR